MKYTKLSQLSDLSIAIWGGGRDGRAAAQRCIEQQCSVVLVTDSPNNDFSSQQLAHELNLDLVPSSSLEKLSIEFLIRSPGVSRYRSEIIELAARNTASSNLFALWLADQPPQRIIGGTGTKGKSTTATLIEQLIASTGTSVALCGNIGIPVTHIDPNVEFVVVEVSSYQASDCTTSPEVGVLTSLGEDHITWHGSLQQYHHDKLNLFAHHQLKKMVFHLDDDIANTALKSLSIDKRYFTSSFDITDIVERSRASGALMRMGHTTFPRNLALAIHAAYAVAPTLTTEHIFHTCENVVPLPSRQEHIGIVNGVEFIDDALASNPIAAMSAVERFADAPMVLIIGGQDRTVDYSQFVNMINESNHVRHVVVMGEADDSFAERVSPQLQRCIRTSTSVMGDAVNTAFSLARPGWRIVFSPSAPTWPSQGDFTVRSQDFRSAMEQTSSLS